MKTIGVKALYNFRDKIKNVEILGNKGNLEWKASADKVDITLPSSRKGDEFGFVLKVELK